jgi:hypothetical protein
MNAIKNNVKTSMTCSALILAALAGTALAQPCDTQQKILGSSPAASDNFANDVSMSFGGPNNQVLMAVGKPGEDAPTAGTDAGGWAVYRLSNGSWSMLYDAWNTTGQGGERAGASIGLADPYMIVGAPGFNSGQGRARILRRPDGSSSWTVSTDVTILAPNSPAGAEFGSSVAISAVGGGWAVVGAPMHDWNFVESGSAYFYTRDPNTNQWNAAFQIWGGDFGGEAGGHRGESVAMSQTTPWAAVGSPDETDSGQAAGHGVVTMVQRMANGNVSGAVQQFRSPSAEGGERFGAAVALEGTWLVVGAPQEDATFQETGFQYQATNCGAVYTYELVNGTWTFRSKLRSPVPTSEGKFGNAVSHTGNQFVVSEAGTRKVHVFALQGGEWKVQATFNDPDSVGGGSYGNAVGIYQGEVAIADRMDDHTSVTDVGAVYTTSIQSAAQSGDLCSDPISMPTGDFTGCTATATPSNGTVTTCGNGGSGQGNDVWFRFEPACDGNAIIDTFGSQFDTVLSVHSDCPSFVGGNSIACNDDHTFPAPNNRASLLTFNFTGGQTYLIRVSGYNGANGSYTLRSLISYGVNNDECSTATTVGMSSFNFNTCAATTSFSAGVPFGSNRDVWYRFIAPAAGFYSFDTCGSEFDTVVTLFNGSQQACPANAAAMIAQNDDSAGFCEPGYSNKSRVKVQLAQSQSVMVRVGGYDGNSFGPATLTIAQTGQCNDVDFNNDGSVFDPMDIDAFLSVFSEGQCIPAEYTCDSIDFNNDTSVFDPMDIDAFLSVFSEGPCF